MKPPRVTVAVPVKNGADFLADAINSALAQTWPDLEVLVVDDGSDDGGATAAVAWSFGERIRFLQQENQGVSGALNTALKAMTGEIFSWLSHDDLLEPDKTALQAEVWMRAGARPDLALFADFRWIDEQGALIGEERAPHELLRSRPSLAVFNGHINGCTLFAPRALLRADGGFHEQSRHVQDYRMWRRLTRDATLLHVPALVARIRRHPGQDSRSSEAQVERGRFWSEVLHEVTEVEAALAAGSLERFLRASADFLRHRTPNREIAAEALGLAEARSADALVSVVVDIEDDPSGGGRSLDSVLRQTHGCIEVVATGSPARLASSAAAALGERADIRLRPSDHPTATGRLRDGATTARGAYIALLEAPAVFRPEKVAVQLRAMSAAGLTLSHTSYLTPDGARRSGAFTGRVYPEIMGRCPVLLSTVMLHRAEVASGLLFADDEAPAEWSWIELAARRDVLGLDEILTEAPGDPSDAPERLEALLLRLEEDPLHGRQPFELERLRRRLEASVLDPAGLRL